MEEILKNELAFYSKLAKPLILNLPRSKDRILAAAWIKKFWEENAGTEKLRTNYLKLLLFSLQRRKLVGIFADDPIDYDLLEEFPLDYDLNELAKNLIEQEQEDKKAKYRKEMMGEMDVLPAFTTDCSPDLTEYVAAQDIPNFGVHCYYAISQEPINKWQQHEKAILPKGTKSAIDTSQSPTAIAQTLSESRAALKSSAKAVSPPIEREQQGEPSPAKRRKTSPKKLGKRPPSYPIGVVKAPEERFTPTWGTNILDVREILTVGEEQRETEEIAEEEDVDLEEELDFSKSDFLAGIEDPDADNMDQEMTMESRKTLDEWKKESLGKRKSQLKKPRAGIPEPRSKRTPTGESTRIGGTTTVDQSGMESTIQQRTRIELDPNMTDLAPFAADEPSAAEGVLDDEGLACEFQDQQETEIGERDITETTRYTREITPAIAKGIPVTTPKPFPSPRRPRSPDKLFAEPGDDLIIVEQPPLGIPPIFGRRELPEIRFTSPTPPRQDEFLPKSTRKGESPNITQLFEEIKTAVEQDEEYQLQKQSEEGRRIAEEMAQMQYLQISQQQEPQQKTHVHTHSSVRFLPGSPEAQEIIREAEEALDNAQNKSAEEEEQDSELDPEALAALGIRPEDFRVFDEDYLQEELNLDDIPDVEYEPEAGILAMEAVNREYDKHNQEYLAQIEAMERELEAEGGAPCSPCSPSESPETTPISAYRSPSPQRRSVSPSFPAPQQDPTLEQRRMAWKDPEEIERRILEREREEQEMFARMLREERGEPSPEQQRQPQQKERKLKAPKTLRGHKKKTCGPETCAAKAAAKPTVPGQPRGLVPPGTIAGPRLPGASQRQGGGERTRGQPKLQVSVGEIPQVAGGRSIPRIGGTPQLSATGRSQIGGIPRPGGGIPRPGAGIPRPGAGIPRPGAGIPRPGAVMPPSGIARPASAGGAPRPGGIPRFGGIPRPAGAAAAGRPPSPQGMEVFFPDMSNIPDQQQQQDWTYQQEMEELADRYGGVDVDLFGEPGIDLDDSICSPCSSPFGSPLGLTGEGFEDSGTLPDQYPISRPEGYMSPQAQPLPDYYTPPRQLPSADYQDYWETQPGPLESPQLQEAYDPWMVQEEESTFRGHQMVSYTSPSRLVAEEPCVPCETAIPCGTPPPQFPMARPDDYFSPQPQAKEKPAKSKQKKEIRETKSAQLRREKLQREKQAEEEAKANEEKKIRQQLIQGEKKRKKSRKTDIPSAAPSTEDICEPCSAPPTSRLRPPSGLQPPSTGIGRSSGLRPPGSGLRPPTAGLSQPSGMARPSGLRPPGSGIRPPSRGIPQAVSGIARPSGLQPPGTGLRPPSSGIVQPSGLRPPGSGLRPPTSGIARPSGLRPPGSGLRPPSSGMTRPSGLRPPCTGLQPPSRAVAAPPPRTYADASGRGVPFKYPEFVPQDWSLDAPEWGWADYPSPPSSPEQPSPERTPLESLRRHQGIRQAPARRLGKDICRPCDVVPQPFEEDQPVDMYHPDYGYGTRDWKFDEDDFQESVQAHEIPEDFYDPNRGEISAVIRTGQQVQRTMDRWSQPPDAEVLPDIREEGLSPCRTPPRQRPMRRWRGFETPSPTPPPRTPEPLGKWTPQGQAGPSRRYVGDTSVTPQGEIGGTRFNWQIGPDEEVVDRLPHPPPATRFPARVPKWRYKNIPSSPRTPPAQYPTERPADYLSPLPRTPPPQYPTERPEDYLSPDVCEPCGALGDENLAELGIDLTDLDAFEMNFLDQDYDLDQMELDTEGAAFEQYNADYDRQTSEYMTQLQEEIAAAEANICPSSGGPCAAESPRQAAPQPQPSRQRMSPLIDAVDDLEARAIQREREDAEEFARMIRSDREQEARQQQMAASQRASPTRSPVSVCPAMAPPPSTPPAPPRYPVEGIAYSPPRPTSRLPHPSLVQRQESAPSPPRFRVPVRPPVKPPAAVRSPVIEADDLDLELMSLPSDDELWDECQPCSPESPEIDPTQFRRAVRSAYAPEYDPRSETFAGVSRTDRRAMREPGLPWGIREGEEPQMGMPSEQLIDYDACFPCGDQSYMGADIIPGQRAPRKRREPLKKRIRHKLELGANIEEIYKKMGQPLEYIEEVIEEPEPEPAVFDLPVPQELPRPISPSNYYGYEETCPALGARQPKLQYDPRLVRSMPRDQLNYPLPPELQLVQEDRPMEFYFPAVQDMQAGLEDEGFVDMEFEEVDEASDPEIDEYIRMTRVPPALRGDRLVSPASCGATPCYTPTGTPPTLAPFDFDEYDDGIFDIDQADYTEFEQTDYAMPEDTCPDTCGGPEQEAQVYQSPPPQRVSPVGYKTPPREDIYTSPSPLKTPYVTPLRRFPPRPLPEVVYPEWLRTPPPPPSPPPRIPTPPKEMLFRPEDMPQMGTPPRIEIIGEEEFPDIPDDFSPLISPSDYPHRTKKSCMPCGDEDLAQLLPVTPVIEDYYTPDSTMIGRTPAPVEEEEYTPDYQLPRRCLSPPRSPPKTLFDVEYNEWMENRRREEIRRQRHLRRQFPLPPRSPGPSDEWYGSVQQHVVPEEFKDATRSGRMRQLQIGLKNAPRIIERRSRAPKLPGFREEDEYARVMQPPKGKSKKAKPKRELTKAEMLKEAREKYKNLTRDKAKKARSRTSTAASTATSETSVSSGGTCGATCPSAAARAPTGRIFERQPGPGAVPPRRQPAAAQPPTEGRAEQIRKQMEAEARMLGIPLADFERRLPGQGSGVATAPCSGAVRSLKAPKIPPGRRPPSRQDFAGSRPVPGGPSITGRQLGERPAALRSLKPPKYDPMGRERRAEPTAPVGPSRSGRELGERPAVVKALKAPKYDPMGRATREDYTAAVGPSRSGRELGQRPAAVKSLKAPRLDPMGRQSRPEEAATVPCGPCGSGRQLGERPPPPKALRAPQLNPMRRSEPIAYEGCGGGCGGSRQLGERPSTALKSLKAPKLDPMRRRR